VETGDEPPTVVVFCAEFAEREFGIKRPDP
jgi:hypothetical protein